MNSERLIFTLLRIGAAGMLVLALTRRPIDYYTILRFVVCGVCAYGVYLAVRWKQSGWAFPFGALTLLFNPLWPLLIKRATWVYIDVMVAAFLILSIFIFRPKSNQGSSHE